MYIKKEFIEKLKDTANVHDVISQYVTLKKQGKDFIACCPFHSEKSPSFYVSPIKNRYHCFGCGKSGDSLKFIMDHLNLDFISAVEHLSNSLGLEVEYEKGNLPDNHINKDEKNELFDLIDNVTSFYQQSLYKDQLAKQYLIQRGLTEEIVSLYRIGFAPNKNIITKTFAGTDQNKIKQLTKIHITGISEQTQQPYDIFRDRIMFPIMNFRNGKIVGFGGRTITNHKSKYINSSNNSAIYNKSNEIYGLYQAIKLNKGMIDKLVLVEGYMDVVSLTQFGLPIGVAASGTTISDGQIKNIMYYTNNLIFIFDGDSAGIKATFRAIEVALNYKDQTNTSKNFKILTLPDNNDPDSYIRKYGVDEFKKRLNESTDIIDFIFNNILKELREEGEINNQRLLVERIFNYYILTDYHGYKFDFIHKLEQNTSYDRDLIENLFSIMAEEKQEQIKNNYINNSIEEVKEEIDEYHDEEINQYDINKINNLDNESDKGYNNEVNSLDRLEKQIVDAHNSIQEKAKTFLCELISIFMFESSCVRNINDRKILIYICDEVKESIEAELMLRMYDYCLANIHLHLQKEDIYYHFAKNTKYSFILTKCIANVKANIGANTLYNKISAYIKFYLANKVKLHGLKLTSNMYNAEEKLVYTNFIKELQSLSRKLKIEKRK